MPLSHGIKANPSASPLISEREIDQIRPLKVIYIGAGVSGIAGAIAFRKAVPSLELVIYEKNPELGGTWYENRYPGCACDVPSHSYQLSYESSVDWTQFYASGPEILSYWKAVAHKYDIRKYIKFQHSCTEARWDEDRSKWIVKLLRVNGTPQPDVVEDSADVLVTGTGTLNKWKWPEISGLEDFSGKLLHSADWDTTFDAKDKAVAVIGGGSSGIQIVPALAPHVKRMDHYLRGKNWISSQFSEKYVKERGSVSTDGNFTYTTEERQAWQNDPRAYTKYRKELESTIQGFYDLSLRGNSTNANVEHKFQEVMRKRLEGRPELIEKMLPDFPPLCRRQTPGPGYLEALATTNVETIHKGISHVDSIGIVTNDGVHRPVDAIICATGFETSFASGFPIYGRDGLNLRSKFRHRPKTYLGVCTDGFPNYFQSLGPNSFQGTGPLLIVIETVQAYIAKILQRLATGNIKTVEPKRTAVDKFYKFCEEYFKRTVFTEDCLSWYKTAQPGASTTERMRGRVTALWPGSCVHELCALKEVRWEDFDLEYLDGNEFGWFGNGCTVADRTGDIEGLTWYLNTTNFVDFAQQNT